MCYSMIWGYGILYLQFGATLHVNKGLIKNSVIFKIVKLPLSLTSYQWSVPQGAQSPQTLYYITLHYIILWLQYPCILQRALYTFIISVHPFSTCTVLPNKGKRGRILIGFLPNKEALVERGRIQCIFIL